MKIEIHTHEAERLRELLAEYRAGVRFGEITGYGQSREEELDDIDTLADKLTKDKS